MDYLKTWIKLALQEAAFKPEDAVSQNLALYVKELGRLSLKCILYNPRLVENNFKAMLLASSEGRETPMGNVGCIYGVVYGVFKRRCEALEVKMAAARSGYGPMLYDAAMQHSPNGFIMSDRFSVSPHAESIWTYYRSRRADVQAIKLMPDCFGEHNRIAKVRPDLLYRYTGSFGTQFNNLMDAHQNAMAEIGQDIGMDQDVIEDFLETAADEFFEKIYHKKNPD